MIPGREGHRALPNGGSAGRAGQVAGPIVHEPAPALEKVRARIGRLDPVPDPMRQGRLDDLPGMIRRPPNSVKVFTGL